MSRILQAKPSPNRALSHLEIDSVDRLSDPHDATANKKRKKRERGTSLKPDRIVTEGKTRAQIGDAMRLLFQFPP